MSSSPSIHANADLINCEVIFGGDAIKRDDPVQIYSIVITKELNNIPRAELEIVDGWLFENQRLGGTGYRVLDERIAKIKPGEKIEIKAAYRIETPVTIFKGIITKTGMKLKDGRHTMITIECADETLKTTLQRRNEYFLDMKDHEIIGEALKKYGLPYSPKSKTEKKHKEVVQYNSSDWDFIASRADVNGRSLLVNDGTIELVKPMEDFQVTLGLTFGLDFNKANFSLDGSSQINEVKCNAWNMAEQKIVSSIGLDPNVDRQGDASLFGNLLSKKFMTDPFELHLTGPLDKEELKVWAGSQMLKSRLSRIRGSITFQGSSKVKLNSFIDLKKSGRYFDGPAYVSKIIHTIQGGNWLTEVGLGMDENWFTETKQQVQTASAAGMLPGIEGLYNGVVRQIHDDPDGDTRVLVDVPVIKDESDSKGIWARMSTFYASDKAGIFFMPEEGDEVILGFLHNDPRFPIIIGSVYSKKRVVPKDQDKKQIEPDADNSIKAIVTKNQLKIIFEDKDKNIIIHTPNKNRIVISDEKEEIIIEDQHKNIIKMEKGGITIKSPKDIKMEGRNISIKASQKVDINAGSSLKAVAKGQFEAKGSTAKVKGQGTAELSSSGMTSVKGTAVKLN